MESDNSSPSARPNGSNHERGVSPSDRSTPRKFQSGSVEQNNNDYMDNRSYQQRNLAVLKEKRPNERSNNSDKFKERMDRDGSRNEGRNSSRGFSTFLKKVQGQSSFGDSDRGSSRSSGNSSSSGRSSGNSSSSNGNSSGRKSQDSRLI